MENFKFIDTDPKTIETEIITVYEAVAGYTLYPGDPRRLFLQTIADLITHQRVLIDYAAKQNLLRYAEAQFLEARGEDEGVPRLQPESAKTTLKFEISSVQPGATTIPIGTRATADGKLFFATVQNAEVPAGEILVEVTAECTEPGLTGNGLLSGQISKIVDPFPLFKSVVNTTETFAGSDIENEDAYRERIRQREETYSTAGPIEGYEYWAKTASAAVVDVSVTSPVPGEVVLRVLLQGGELPNPEILDAVFDACNDRKVRPLTDLVSVLAPDIVNYDIGLTYWISSTDATKALEIQEEVSLAVNDYQTWQKAKLGRDINPSELIARIMKAGARRVQLDFPAYQELTPSEVAIAENVTVTYGGLEDD